MQHQLPDQIVWKNRKIGFETPQQEWMQSAVMQDKTFEAKKKLVQAGVLKPAVLAKKIQPLAVHAADNFDWRYLVAAACM